VAEGYEKSAPHGLWCRPVHMSFVVNWVKAAFTFAGGDAARLPVISAHRIGFAATQEAHGYGLWSIRDHDGALNKLHVLIGSESRALNRKVAKRG